MLSSQTTEEQTIRQLIGEVIALRRNLTTLDENEKQSSEVIRRLESRIENYEALVPALNRRIEDLEATSNNLEASKNRIENLYKTALKELNGLREDFERYKEEQANERRKAFFQGIAAGSGAASLLWLLLLLL